MILASHDDEDNFSPRHRMHAGLTSGRTSLDDYSPSDVTSIFSEDYLNNGILSPSPSTAFKLAGSFNHIDWIGVAITLNDWNLKVFKLCTPSFLHRLCSEQDEQRLRLSNDIEQGHAIPKQITSPNESGSIKCLDGLRGVACFFVFNFHFLYPYTRTITNGFGAPYGDGARLFNHAHQLPFIALPYRGRAMVSVFFAISGYVLSRKVLINCRSGNADSARRSLSSSVFRRALRLYLPPTVSMFLVMIMVYVGMFLSEKQIYAGPYSKYIGGSWEEHPPRARWLVNQFSHWFNMWVAWGNPFTWQPFYNLYDPHTWTIPLEFRSSIVLFATLLGTANLKSKWRLMLTFTLTLYCLRMARWDVGLFLGGMLMCELDLVAGTFDSEPEVDCMEKLQWKDTRSNKVMIHQLLRGLFTWLVFIIALYLLSFPDSNSRQTPGYITVANLTPKAYPWEYLLWHALGAICAVWSVNNLHLLRTIFECALFQYLGKISFAFYLVHGPLLHSIGFRLMPEIWKITGFNSDEGFVGGLVIGWCIMVLLSIWCADLFWRFVDIPSTKLARKIERCVSVRTT